MECMSAPEYYGFSLLLIPRNLRHVIFLVYNYNINYHITHNYYTYNHPINTTSLYIFDIPKSRIERESNNSIYKE